VKSFSGLVAWFVAVFFAFASIFFAISCSTITAPELISPANGKVVLSNTPKFIWHSTSSIRYYIVQISATQDFKTHIDTLLFGDTSFVLQDTLSLGKKYYWRVIAATIQNQESPPSDIGIFKTDSGIIILTPTPADSTSQPSFSWKPFKQANFYRLMVSDKPDFSDTLIDTTTSNTSLKLNSPLEQKTYFWRIRGLVSGKPLTPWSAIRRLVAYRLTDTYFPLHWGRVQKFEQLHASGKFTPDANTWDTTLWKVDTISVSITDTFTQEGRFFYALSDTFYDIGYQLSIHHDSIFTSNFYMGNLFPSEFQYFKNWQDTAFTVRYHNDTMYMFSRHGTPVSSGYDSTVIVRLPAKGVIKQAYYKERLGQLGDPNSWELFRLTLLK